MHSHGEHTNSMQEHPRPGLKPVIFLLQGNGTAKNNYKEIIMGSNMVLPQITKSMVIRRRALLAQTCQSTCLDGRRVMWKLVFLFLRYMDLFQKISELSQSK